MYRQGDLAAQKRQPAPESIGRCVKKRFEGDLSRNKSNRKLGRRIEGRQEAEGGV